MCEWGLKGELGGPKAAPVGGKKEGGVMLGRCDSLRLCPQVELRSYVSEPELASFAGDMAQPSLGLVGPESRYQTLPGRGKERPSLESFGDPTCHHITPNLQPRPTSSACTCGLGSSPALPQPKS